MSIAQTRAVQLSAAEGTTYIPFKPRKRKATTEPATDANKPTPGVRMSETYPLNWKSLRDRLNKDIFEELKPTITQLVHFAKEDRTSQESEFGVNEIPAALVVGRDRALLSALLNKAIRIAANEEEYDDKEYDGGTDLLVVRLDEGDCSNTASAVRALVGGFMAQFEETDAEMSVKKKTSTTLAPFDMARLVAGYEDYFTSREMSSNLVVIIEQLEAFDTEVIQGLVYACSKHLDSLPISFIVSVSDSSYIQHAFTTATRTMLDTTILGPPSGSALCLAVLQRTLSYRDNFEREIILGESSIKVLKDVITRTDGRIDALTTTLQLIHMEHCWYQIEVFDAAARHVAKVEPLLQVKTPANVDKDVVYGPDLKITVQPENVLLAFLTLDKRKGALADGFFPADVDKTFTKYTLYQQAETLGHEPCCDRMNQSRYGLVALLHLTWSFYERGAYRQEVPLPFLDLLELAAKGPNDIEKYATWMLKKGFQSTSDTDLAVLSQSTLDHIGESDRYKALHVLRSWLKSLNEATSNNKELNQKSRAEHIDTIISMIKECINFDQPAEQLSRSGRAYRELYITESTDGLKELLDPAPRSVILSGLIRPGAYLRCECCDPEESHTPENMAQMPDTCALFQRSLDAGRLLNIADWFGAFANITQNEHVKRITREPEPARKSRSVSRSRRATSSVHMESDADAEGEIDEVLEMQQEYQARFLQSAHELELLGLIQATGRRKEHVLRTVFETGE